MPKASRKRTASARLVKKREFKGVRKRKGGVKWVSEVRVPNSAERIWLGSYHTPEEAARAYDYAVYCLRGAKAQFNFPDFWPQNLLAPSFPLTEIQAAAAKYAVEGFRQASEKDVAFYGNESETCVDGQLILEEQNPELLDSLLQELQSSQSINADDDFSAQYADDFSAQYKPLDDSDFLAL